MSSIKDKVFPIKVINVSDSVNENIDICTLCGGKCCKSMPGRLHPNQVIKDMDNSDIMIKIYDLIKSGEYIIYSSSYNDIKVIIPRITKVSSEIYSVRNITGTCNFLTQSGCSKVFDERPLECQELTPGIDFCENRNKNILNEIEIEWNKYQVEIDAVINTIESESN